MGVIFYSVRNLGAWITFKKMNLFLWHILKEHFKTCVRHSNTSKRRNSFDRIVREDAATCVWIPMNMFGCTTLFVPISAICKNIPTILQWHDMQSTSHVWVHELIHNIVMVLHQLIIIIDDYAESTTQMIKYFVHIWYVREQV
jgi:hypothetical protein